MELNEFFPFDDDLPQEPSFGDSDSDTDLDVFDTFQVSDPMVCPTCHNWTLFRFDNDAYCIRCERPYPQFLPIDSPAPSPPPFMPIMDDEFDGFPLDTEMFDWIGFFNPSEEDRLSAAPTPTLPSDFHAEF